MAEQFGPATVTLQPTAPEQPIQSNVLEQGASTFGQASAQSVGIASALGQRASGYFAQANAAFDRTVDQYNKIAVMNAQDEAPGLIQKDGQGQIIPPKSFWPSGIHSTAYAQAYSDAARSTYRTMAASEFSNFVSETQAKYPTDPVAFQKAVDEKQGAMLQNLDTREAPFISLRLQQIAAQGGTQVAVNLQAANNATLKASSDVSYGAIVDTASRMAGLTAPVAAFGGKDNPAAPGTIKTITDSLPPEVQQRVTSSDRTPEHNAQVGGARDSAHLKPGTAVDIGTAGMTDEQKKALVSQVLANPNLRGIGFYDDHIHIDTGHDKHTVWGSVPGSVQNDVRNWQGAPTAMSAIPTSTDIEKIKTQVASSALVAGMLADWQKQVGPIMTPGEIARKKDELAYKVVAKSYAESFKSGRYDDGKGNIDQGKIALANGEIEKIAAAFPGREDDVRKTLQEGLQFSVGQSSRFAAQQQLDDKRRIEPQQRRAMDLALQADALKNTDVDGARRITDQLRQEARDALHNPSINDAAALTLAQTYYSNGNLARSSMQEGITNKIQALDAVIQNPAASQDQKAAAHASAQTIRNTPELYNEMNAGQRNYLQGTMDAYVTANYGAQVQAYNNKILADPPSPAEVAKVREFQFKNNMIQPKDYGSIAQVDAAAAKLYQEKQTQSAQAAQLVDDFTKGKQSTPEVRAAHEKEVNKRPPKGAPSWDLSNPEHIVDLQNFYSKNGYLPAQAKAALDKIPHSPDANVMAGPMALYETIQQVERKQAEKTLGTDYDKGKEALITANIAAAVGDNASYLAMAKLYDPATANKMELAYGNKGQAGSTGMTADQAKQGVGAGVDALAGLLAKKDLNVFAQGAETPGTLMTAEGDLTSEQRAQRAAAEIAPGGTGIGGWLSNMIGATTAGSYDNVVFTPEVKEELTRNGVVHLANDGNALRTIMPGAGQPEQFVANTAFFTGVRDNRYEATRSADGKTLTIGYKSLGGHLSPQLGIQIPAGSRAEQGLAAGILSAENFRLGRDLQDLDQDRVSTMPYQATNGQMRFLIAYKDRNGNVTQHMDIAKDDPRLGIQAQATVKAASQAVIANAADPYAYGQVLMAGATGAGPGAIMLLKDGTPASNWVKYSTIIGNTVQQMQLALNRPGMMEAMLGDRKLLSPDQLEARKNMQIEARRRLMDLDAELKKNPDAPGLSQVLSHMIQNPGPGSPSTGVQNIIRDSGFYQPGREPIDRGKTRTGKEDTR